MTTAVTVTTQSAEADPAISVTTRKRGRPPVHGTAMSDRYRSRLARRKREHAHSDIAHTLLAIATAHKIALPDTTILALKRVLGVHFQENVDKLKRDDTKIS